MCSSPSARGPKSQLVMNHQQEDAGTHQKRIHYVQGQRRSWNKIVGGAQHDKIKSHTSWVDDLQSGEECYQRSSPTDVSLMSASQPGDHAKGLGIPRESDFESQWDLITELSKLPFFLLSLSVNICFLTSLFLRSLLSDVKLEKQD